MNDIETILQELTSLSETIVDPNPRFRLLTVFSFPDQTARKTAELAITQLLLNDKYSSNSIYHCTKVTANEIDSFAKYGMTQTEILFDRKIYPACEEKELASVIHANAFLTPNDDPENCFPIIMVYNGSCVSGPVRREGDRYEEPYSYKIKEGIEPVNAVIAGIKIVHVKQNLPNVR